MGKKNKWLIMLTLLAIVIKIFSIDRTSVEAYYSKGLYPLIAAVQRILLGWIPFSVGDLLYGVAILILGRKLIILIRRLINKTANRQYWRSGGRQFVYTVLIVYISFNLLWGLNYNRQGIASQMALDIRKYSKEDLIDVMNIIVERMDNLDSASRLSRNDYHKKKSLFRAARNSYDSLEQQLPEFGYAYPSVKPSMYSYLGNYLGFTGYYNPFSGEAQVNTTVPVFVQPFTTCHEIGHQLGYAKENEANFVGYLAAKSSADPAFRYSAYFDMYSYSWFYLYTQDSLQAREFNKRLPVGVISDQLQLREFYRRHRNPVEAVIDKLYGQYLKANEQPSGKLAYNEVIAWLVAYYKKFGKEAV